MDKNGIPQAGDVLFEPYTNRFMVIFSCRALSFDIWDFEYYYKDDEFQSRLLSWVSNAVSMHHFIKTRQLILMPKLVLKQSICSSKEYSQSFLGKEVIQLSLTREECTHEFKTYNGLMEAYDYCVKCDHKRK